MLKERKSELKRKVKHCMFALQKKVYKAWNEYQPGLVSREVFRLKLSR